MRSYLFLHVLGIRTFFRTSPVAVPAKRPIPPPIAAPIGIERPKVKMAGMTPIAAPMAPPATVPAAPPAVPPTTAPAAAEGNFQHFIDFLTFWPAHISKIRVFNVLAFKSLKKQS